MPKTTLKYAKELYDEREMIFRELNSRYSFEDLMKKENEFVSLCKELASTKGMVRSLPIFLKQSEETLEDSVIWMIGEYIVLLSKDEEAFQKSKNKIYRNAISMLEEKSQKYFIEKFLGEEYLLKVQYIIRDNRYSNYLDTIIKYMNTIEDIRKRYKYYGILALFHKKEYYPEILQAFQEEKSEYQKNDLAFLLLPAPLPEVWEHYQQKTTQGSDEASEILSLYGSPSDFVHIEKCIEKSWDDSSALVNIGNWLRWFGYSNDDAMTLYLKMLKHPSEDVRYTYHLLLFSFLEDDENMQDANELMEEDELDIQTLSSYWNGKKSYLKRTLKENVRMWHGKEFDLLYVLESIEKSPVIGELNGIVCHLRIWTGENFAFDPNALFKRQFEQLEVIKQWLRDNKERFPAGRWYRWGVDIT